MGHLCRGRGRARGNRGEGGRDDEQVFDPVGHLFRQQLSGFSGLHAVGHVEEYLPYSPDSNPIESAFAKLKALLRKASARTVPDLWASIADALPQFTPAECANYFTACGYEPE